MNSHERRVERRSAQRTGQAIKPWMLPGGRPQTTPAKVEKTPVRPKALRLGDTTVLSRDLGKGATGVIVMNETRGYYRIEQGAARAAALNAAVKAPVLELEARGWRAGKLTSYPLVLALLSPAAQQPRAAA